MSFGKPCPVADLFGRSGRDLLARLDLPDPWEKNIATALELIDDLDGQINECEADLRSLGADHPYVSVLQSVPGVAWVRISVIPYTQFGVFEREVSEAA